MKQINKLLILTLFSSLLLSACGGGGGGGSDSGGGSDGNTNRGPASFSGATGNAAINSGNQDQLARTAIEGATYSPKVWQVEMLTNELLPDIPALPPIAPENLPAIYTSIDGAIKDMCTGGGSVSYEIDTTGILSGNVSLSMTLVDCVIDSYSANGKVTAVVTLADPPTLKATFSDDFTLTGGMEDLNLQLASAIVTCTDINSLDTCRLSQFDFVGVNGETYRMGIANVAGNETDGYLLGDTEVYDPDFGAIHIGTPPGGELTFGCTDGLPNTGTVLFNDGIKTVSIEINDCDSYTIQEL